jgi:hypothetical protein
MAGGQVVSEASSRLEIGPPDAPNSLHEAALAQRPFHNYRIPEPKRPYIKFGMTHAMTSKYYFLEVVEQPNAEHRYKYGG